MINHNKIEPNQDKTADISFYAMVVALVIGLILMIGFLVYSFFE